MLTLKAHFLHGVFEYYKAFKYTKGQRSFSKEVLS